MMMIMIRWWLKDEIQACSFYIGRYQVETLKMPKFLKWYYSAKIWMSKCRYVRSFQMEIKKPNSNFEFNICNPPNCYFMKIGVIHINVRKFSVWSILYQKISIETCIYMIYYFRGQNEQVLANNDLEHRHLFYF